MVTHIGTSGWSYAHWDGVLYPPGTPPPSRLELYVEQFSTVEFNASFYRWPKDATFAGWQHRLPPGFTLSVKAPRGLTHAKKLLQPEVWIERISAGWHQLGDKRAVLLVQLAPGHVRDDARLDYFLSALPDWITTVVEFRHPSWVNDSIFSILERHGAGYCIMSGAGLPCVLRATAKQVYIRLHGPDDVHLYGGSYSDDELRWWTERIAEYESRGNDVYAYFNNGGGGNAVRNAVRLREMLA